MGITNFKDNYNNLKNIISDKTENSNYSYNKFTNNNNSNENDNEYIADETIENNIEIQEDENLTSNLTTCKKSEEITTSKSRYQDINVLKSSNNLLNDLNKGNLKENDYIYDDSIRIIKYISEGAQAKVYLGLIEEINKYVAIKRYTLIDADENLIEKICFECDSIKTLDHPNIIKYFDVEINNFNSFITVDLIMEYVKGFSLKEYIFTEDFQMKLHKEEKLDKIKFIVRSLLEGINFLHNNKIIHRDLKVNFFFKFFSQKIF